MFKDILVGVCFLAIIALMADGFYKLARDFKDRK